MMPTERSKVSSAGSDIRGTVASVVSPPEDPADGKTDKDLVATAYLGWSARHLAASAEALGRDRDAAYPHR